MPELIFVYNARSDPFNVTLDFVHKMVSPETYSCNLCKVTYGFVSEKKEWKTFRKAGNIKMTFLYSNQFEKQYQTTLEYPVILIKHKTPEILLSSTEINKIKDVTTLIMKIKSTLNF